METFNKPVSLYHFLSLSSSYFSLLKTRLGESHLQAGLKTLFKYWNVTEGKEIFEGGYQYAEEHNNIDALHH